jgi:hypothetical protein
MTHLEWDGEASKRQRRISAKAARRMLGMVGRNYSDADFEEILDCLYSIAELGFDLYQEHSAKGDPTHVE